MLDPFGAIVRRLERSHRTTFGDDVLYAPVVHWKRGEQLALAELRSTALNGIMPVIELPETDFLSSESPAGPSEPVVVKLPGQLTQDAILKAMDAIQYSQFRDRSFYLDPTSLHAEHTLDGTSAIGDVLDQAQRRHFSAIPVLGFDSAGVPQFNVFDTWAEVCFRFDVSLDTTIPWERAAIAIAAGAQVHVILDLRSVAGQSPRRVADRMARIVQAIPSIPLKRIILTSAAFPEGLAEIGHDKLGFLDRTDLLAWKRFRNTFSRTDIPPPIFSDYGIQNSRAPGRIVNPAMSGSIRYTLDDKWLIVRGHRLERKKYYDQFVALARMLRDHRRFMGARHCRGCRAVEDTAEGVDRLAVASLPGWRKHGTIHHLTKTIAQLRSLRGAEVA